MSKRVKGEYQVSHSDGTRPMNRDKKTGKLLQMDHSGQVRRSLNWWHIDGMPGRYKTEQTVAHLLHRLSLLEDVLRRSPAGFWDCKHCGLWSPHAMLTHNGVRMCEDCIDYTVIDEPEGFSIVTMGGYIIEHELWKHNPDRVRHWCEYMLVDGEPATDLAEYVEKRMRRAGAVEFTLSV